MRFGATFAAAVWAASACTSDQPLQQSSGVPQAGPTDSCPAGACFLVRDGRVLRMAASTDSAGTPVELGAVAVRGRAGDAVTLRLVADPAVLRAAGPRAALLVRADGEERSAGFDALARGAVAYRFTDDGEVVLSYALPRTVAAASDGAFTIALETSARVRVAKPLWAGGRLGPEAALSVMAQATCQLTAAAGTCGDVEYTISPFAPGSPFGDFQSNSGTGASSAITISFSSPIQSITVTIEDPTFAGNTMTASGPSGSVGSVSFAFSGQPGTNIPDTQTLSGEITSVLLVPAADDYVAYRATVVAEDRQLVVECTPTTVTRGEEVTCTARLNTDEEWTATIVTSRASNGQTAFATFDVIEDGKAIESRGPAVFSSTVTVEGLFTPPSGIPEAVDGTATFTVEARADFSAPQLPGDPIVLEDALHGGGRPPLLGGYTRPALDLGQQGASQLQLQPVSDGPNAGFSYLLAPPALKQPLVLLHAALGGSGGWYNDQDGEDHGNTTGPLGLRYCVGADITGTLKADVIRHEGALPPTQSHHSIWVTTVLPLPASIAVFETAYFDTRQSDAKIRSDLIGRWTIFTDGAYAVYHAPFELADLGPNLEVAQQRIGCEFDNNPGD